MRAVVDFVNQPGDDMNWWNTLLIVTSDHANSYMRLNEAKPLRAGELPAQVGTGSCGYGVMMEAADLSQPSPLMVIAK